ncbi:MAG TPA: hypothetical protein VHD36_17195 [Pirellulales bacterium]|nr:hypothetical protein [Pirellulales bacterium]
MRRSCCGLLVLASLFCAPRAYGASPTEGCAACDAGCAATAVQPTVRRSGSWIIEDTENFSICRPANYQSRPDLAAAVEKVRAELCKSWLCEEDRKAWNPRCQIVIHGRLEGYIKEVGPGARQTTGSSLIDFDKDQVVLRRIDIRGDRADWFTEALPHEMTHVVLADRFTHVQIPHWADEGMAIQADPVAKQRLHGRDLRAAVAAGGEFRLAELLTLDSYPHPSRMGAFYGQSASLVDFLMRVGSKEQLVTFVLTATDQGYDVALREVYDIAGVGALEQQWRRHLRGLPVEREISTSEAPSQAVASME